MSDHTRRLFIERDRCAWVYVSSSVCLSAFIARNPHGAFFLRRNNGNQNTTCANIESNIAAAREEREDWQTLQGPPCRGGRQGREGAPGRGFENLQGRRPASRGRSRHQGKPVRAVATDCSRRHARVHIYVTTCWRFQKCPRPSPVRPFTPQSCCYACFTHEIRSFFHNRCTHDICRISGAFT